MRIINKTIVYIISFMFILLMLACHHEHGEGGHSHGEDDGHGHDDHGSGKTGQEGHHKDDEIHLTKEQMEIMNIMLGDFSSIKINDFVRATGTLGLPPNAYTSINTKANGFIRNSNKYVEGDYIAKGFRVANLENAEFIQHQREYLEIKAELVYLQQELDRQRSLVEANAGVTKKVQQLQADVNMKQASLKGISKMLGYWGINTENISQDNMVSSVVITAPMTGYITSINMHNGMYVNPEQELMEIVSENHFHLELDVFEKDIAHIKEEQLISYTVPALGNEVYEGEVHIIGKEFNMRNKTVRIHGHPEKERPRFIKDLFVEAKIWLNDQTVEALPEKAIIKNGANSYIYVTADDMDTEELTFKAKRIIPGTTDDGFTEIKLIDKIPEGMRIVTHGAYYVYAQSTQGELEHSH